MLDAGRIAESGTHQSLVAAGGLYAAMVSHAHGGVIDGSGEEASEDAVAAPLTLGDEFD
jgi:ATP-binding cassette subfamily B multidrug efflux pump